MRKNKHETIVSRPEEADLSAEYFPHGYPEPEKFLAGLKERHPEMLETYQTVLKLCETFREEGGQALLVGGSVRDYYFGFAPKDYDLEIYRVEPDRIREIISEFGTVKETGESFSVLKLFLPNGHDIDVSLPRTENKTGPGHRDFSAKADPYMSIEQAALRRDFTINSLAANPLTGEVYNYFDGINDIKNRILRVTNEVKFREDAIRILRGVQFIGRMNLTMEDDTKRIMMDMVPELENMAPKRHQDEWIKLFEKTSSQPSLGLIAAKELGVLRTWLPDLDELSEIPQEADWHPEGDVWRHTLMSVDAIKEQIDFFGLDSQEQLNVMLATLCHDLGKATTTEFSEAKGRIISHGHEEAGAEPTLRVLKAMGFHPNNIEVQKIIKLVTEHLSPTMHYIESQKTGSPAAKKMNGTIRRLAKRIQPATIRELVAVATADHLGRGPFTEEGGQTLLNLYEAGQWLIERAENLGVQREPAPQILSGKTLLARGFRPGVKMGEIIGLADHLRDEKNFTQADVLRELPETKPADLTDSQYEEQIINHLRGLLK